jgi:hypothetical protein
MKIRILLTIVIIFEIASSTISQNSSVCLISPPHLTLQVPAQGFASLDSILYKDPCDTVADNLWMRQAADSFDLLVAAVGPFGSGRYWTVTIGLAMPGQKIPSRGFCLTTTTIGWRTLRDINNLPLPWLGDRNANGRPEIIIWDSFPLHEEASMAEFGLIAWIYEYSSKGMFNINWHLSREIAAEIASAYRNPVENSRDWLKKMRDNFARYLEDFASKK